jgi:hypothetical protein
MRASFQATGVQGAKRGADELIGVGATGDEIRSRVCFVRRIFSVFENRFTDVREYGTMRSVELLKGHNKVRTRRFDSEQASNQESPIAGSK